MGKWRQSKRFALLLNQLLRPLARTPSGRYRVRGNLLIKGNELDHLIQRQRHRVFSGYWFDGVTL